MEDTRGWEHWITSLKIWRIADQPTNSIYLLFIGPGFINTNLKNVKNLVRTKLRSSDWFGTVEISVTDYISTLAPGWNNVSSDGGKGLLDIQGYY